MNLTPPDAEVNVLDRREASEFLAEITGFDHEVFDHTRSPTGCSPGPRTEIAALLYCCVFAKSLARFHTPVKFPTVDVRLLCRRAATRHRPRRARPRRRRRRATGRHPGQIGRASGRERGGQNV